MGEGTGKGVAYNGPASAMKDSDWLTVEDMQGMRRPHIDLIVDEVLKHRNLKFKGGRTEEKKYSLKFKGADKQLLLNSTNIDRMIAWYGKHTSDWIGVKVRLHLEEDKLPAGGRGPCTRIVRCPDSPPAAPSTPANPEPPAPGPPQHEQNQLDGMPSEDNWTEGLDD